MSIVSSGALFTVLAGTLNNVSSKIRSTALGPFNYMTAVFNAVLYLCTYFIIAFAMFCAKSNTIHNNLKYLYTNRQQERVHSLMTPLLGNRPLSFSSVTTPVPYYISDGISDSDQEMTLHTSTKWILILLAGALDCLAATLGFIAQQHLPQIIYQLSLQSIIVFSVLFSAIFMKRVYSIYHMVAVVLTLTGCVIAVSPAFGESLAPPVPYVLALFSTVPTALSFLIKEVLYHDYSNSALGANGGTLNVFFLGYHIALFQVLFAPLASLVNIFAGEVSLDRLGYFLNDSLKCMLGDSPVHGEYFTDPDCSSAPVSYITYAIINVLFNISIARLTRSESSPDAWMVIRIILPTTCAALALPIWPLLTPRDSGITVCTLCATGLVILGSWLFRVSSKYVQSMCDKQGIRSIKHLWPLRY